MNFKLIGAALIAVSLGACSTVVNGSNQSVAFNTGEVEGADCMITGGSDNALSLKFTSPAEVKIPRSKKALSVDCSKAGYTDAHKIVNSKVEGSTAGNILAGGVIGVGVDALTGAMYRYPDTVKIVMDKLGMNSAEDAPMSEGEPTT